MHSLRPYQERAIELLDDAFDRGARSPLLVLPTGSGKTIIAVELIRKTLRQRQRVLFMAPRTELVRQASEKLHAYDVAHGVIAAGAPEQMRLYERTQVASVDTLLARVVRASEHYRLELPAIDLVIFDEAHLAATEKRSTLLDQWPNARRIGLTATPARKDGRALGSLFDALIEPTTPAELTESGYLVPARYWSLAKPDLERVRTRGGDYEPGELQRRMNRPRLVGDVVATWLDRASDRRTIVFAAGVTHSIALAEEFQRLGVAAEHVDGETSSAERTSALARLADGRLQVLVNCQIATYGIDVPAVSCIVLARPTRSVSMHLQMLGRGLRPADGKVDCLVLDHAGNVLSLGGATEPRAWSLDGLPVVAAQARAGASDDAGSIRECPECRALFAGLPACPECGYRAPKRGRDVVTLPGHLVPLSRTASGAAPTEERRRFFREVLGYATVHGYRPGFAEYKHNERFGEWPPRAWRSLVAIPPTEPTLRWLKHRAIAFAKSRTHAA